MAVVNIDVIFELLEGQGNIIAIDQVVSFSDITTFMYSKYIYIYEIIIRVDII